MLLFRVNPIEQYGHLNLRSFPHSKLRWRLRLPFQLYVLPHCGQENGPWTGEEPS